MISERTCSKDYSSLEAACVCVCCAHVALACFDKRKLVLAEFNTVLKGGQVLHAIRAWKASEVLQNFQPEMTQSILQ